MTAGDLIRIARLRAGLTQTELARRAGTTQPVISAYEHGRRDPTVETLRKLVGAAGQRLVVRAEPTLSDVPPPADLYEHGQRLLDVLSLADALPHAPRRSELKMPRLVSE